MLDLTGVSNLFTDFNDIEWVIVTTSLGFRVRMVGVFPSLRVIVKSGEGKREREKRTYLRESTIVPDVTLVRETVADISKFTLLGILNDGVHGDFLADL